MSQSLPPVQASEAPQPVRVRHERLADFLASLPKDALRNRAAQGGGSGAEGEDEGDGKAGSVLQFPVREEGVYTKILPEMLKNLGSMEQWRFSLVDHTGKESPIDMSLVTSPSSLLPAHNLIVDQYARNEIGLSGDWRLDVESDPSGKLLLDATVSSKPQRGVSPILLGLLAVDFMSQQRKKGLVPENGYSLTSECDKILTNASLLRVTGKVAPSDDPSARPAQS